jgi:hypothetical protein
MCIISEILSKIIGNAHRFVSRSIQMHQLALSSIIQAANTPTRTLKVIVRLHSPSRASTLQSRNRLLANSAPHAYPHQELGKPS